MWIAEIVLDGSESLFGSRAKKYDVSIVGYPLTSYKEREFIYLHVAGFISGGGRNVRKFLKDFAKDDRVINLENNGFFLTALIKEPYKFNVAYHPKFIRVKPTVIRSDGSEIWTIGSWDKKELLDLVDVYEKTHNAQLLKIYKENLKSFFIINPSPNLSKKQRRALDLAISNGYYDYPKRIELEKLANIMGLSYSTYHAHLKKAEKKLLPFFFKNSIETTSTPTEEDD